MIEMLATRNVNTGTELKQYPDLTTEYIDDYKAAFFYMDTESVPCFSPILLRSINNFFSDLTFAKRTGVGNDIRYLVLASKNPGIFNLGGDLSVIKQCVLSNDRDALYEYAVSCIDVLHQNITGLDLGLKTISLVQGDALGGGFEAALSSDYIIAERGVKLGFPESLFNLYPGMGAYNLLSRRIDLKHIRELIFEGQLHTSEELYELGVIDKLAEPGKGVEAVYAHIKRAERKESSYSFLKKMEQKYNPILFEDLEEIIQDWVDCAFSNLTKENLKMMTMLLSKQQNRIK